MLDREVRGKFKEFQEKTGKYGDLDIDKVRFEKRSLDKIATFPAMSRISGGIDKSIMDYNNFSKEEQSNYYPLISGTTENNQISGYIHKDRLSTNSLSNPNVISWTRINSEIFFIQEKPVCTNDDSFIMDVNNNNFVKYILYSTIMAMKSQKFHWGNKAGKSKVRVVKIVLPKDLNKKYTSFVIQKAIVDFLEYSFEIQDNIKKTIDKRYDIFTRLRKSLIPSTFHS